MREVVFALEFRGKAAAVPGTDGQRRARTTASSQTLSTLLTADGVRAGGVLWRITAGDGGFANARGLITSNFTVSPAGDVVDDHFVRVYLP